MRADHCIWLKYHKCWFQFKHYSDAQRKLRLLIATEQSSIALLSIFSARTVFSDLVLKRHHISIFDVTRMPRSTGIVTSYSSIVHTRTDWLMDNNCEHEFPSTQYPRYSVYENKFMHLLCMWWAMSFCIFYTTFKYEKIIAYLVKEVCFPNPLTNLLIASIKLHNVQVEGTNSMLNDLPPDRH